MQESWTAYFLGSFIVVKLNSFRGHTECVTQKFQEYMVLCWLNRHITAWVHASSQCMHLAIWSTPRFQAGT